MNIEELNVSQECFGHLKRAGITTVEEILEFLDDNWGAKIESQWILRNCFNETIDQLKVMGFSLKHEGKNWGGTPRSPR